MAKEEESYKIHVSSAAHPDWDVLVIWDYKKTYTDNCSAWVLQSKVEQAYQSLMEEVYGDCKVFNYPYGFQQSDQFDENTGVEEYLKEITSPDMVVYVAADAANRENDMALMVQKLVDRGWRIQTDILYVDAALLEEVKNSTNKEAADRIKKQGLYYYWGGGILGREGNFNAYKWREGTLK